MELLIRSRRKRDKIWERVLAIGDQWKKMSFRDVRKENMTGFWNILRVKIRSVPFFFFKGGEEGKKRKEKKYKVLSPPVLKKQPKDSQR